MGAVEDGRGEMSWIPPGHDPFTSAKGSYRIDGEQADGLAGGSQQQRRRDGLMNWPSAGRRRRRRRRHVLAGRRRPVE